MSLPKDAWGGITEGLSPVYPFEEQENIKAIFGKIFRLVGIIQKSSPT